MTSEKKREFTLRITNSNRSELIVILFEMCFEYLDDVAIACEKHDVEAIRDSVRKAEQVIRRLQEDLDFSHKISYNLMAVYAFAEKELVRSIIDLKADHAYSVRKILNPIYEGFVEVAKTDKSAPLMRHTEMVYAGMTYGRGYVNESVATGNRGFFA